MTARQQRALRGAVAAGVATLLAAVSHTIAGGPAPTALLVVAVTLLLTPLAAAVVGPRPSLPRLSGAVAVSQVAFHAAFEWIGGPAAAGGVAATSGHGHHHHAAAPLLEHALLGSGAPGDAALMPVAHAAAALLTIALLWRGEQLLRAIARETLAILHRVELPQLPVRSRIALPCAAGPAAPIERRFLSSMRRRGPPSPSRA
ncbi:hypothetical protein [Microbacterium album]|uniref:Uncharacterized protein n=1 Tax=Microbacterium album TaxID=2053191 RepID=A0A917II68_9MICO|nr:hypothetical protein [Microbacterium album]GGH46715.1 hypothetical protein GCM10010921_23000 [Microbacterium album]